MSHALHDPTIERDACGIGLVADARGRASRELVDRALAGLAAVSHRGAWAADGVTGDGAGVLLPLQQALTGIEGAGLDVECPYTFDGTHFARWKNWLTCNFKFISPQMW